MASSIPRLFNFSQKIEESLKERLLNVEKELSSITIAYREFINDMRTQACTRGGYWTFDLNFVTVDEVRIWCESYEDIVVSQQWRLIGSFKDIMSLAKLAGYTYQSQGKEIVLPGFSPEESYWIRSLQMIRLCIDKSVDPDAIMPCDKTYSNILPENPPILWKSHSIKKSKLCDCCTQDICRTQYGSSLDERPFSPIEPVKVFSPITSGILSSNTVKSLSPLISSSSEASRTPVCRLSHEGDLFTNPLRRISSESFNHL